MRFDCAVIIDIANFILAVWNGSVLSQDVCIPPLLAGSIMTLGRSP